jgi:phosphoglycolate phosphatase
LPGVITIHDRSARQGGPRAQGTSPCVTRYKAIIFDLDGTLVHSAPDLHSAANVALKAVGRDPLDIAMVTSFIGRGVEKLIERCLRSTGQTSDSLQETAMAAFMEHYNANSTTLTRPYPGVVECLANLQDSGVALGICTNKPTAPARQVCDALDLSRFFDVIVGSEPEQPRKPDPSPLLRAVRALGVRSGQVLYVGDSDIDHDTAKNAEVAFCLFSGGYLKDPIADLPPDQVFDSWSDRRAPTGQPCF